MTRPAQIRAQQRSAGPVITATLPALARAPHDPPPPAVVALAERNSGGAVLARTIRVVALPDGLSLIAYVAHGQGPFTLVDPRRCLAARVCSPGRAAPPRARSAARDRRAGAQADAGDEPRHAVAHADATRTARRRAARRRRRLVSRASRRSRAADRRAVLGLRLRKRETRPSGALLADLLRRHRQAHDRLSDVGAGGRRTAATANARHRFAGASACAKACSCSPSPAAPGPRWSFSAHATAGPGGNAALGASRAKPLRRRRPKCSQAIGPRFGSMPNVSNAMNCENWRFSGPWKSAEPVVSRLELGAASWRSARCSRACA